MAKGDTAYIVVRAMTRMPESRDFAEKLFGMYRAWGEKSLFVTHVDVDTIGNDGLRLMALCIKGKGVFDLLSGEQGIHQMTYVSPFPSPIDGQKRQVTTFASVEVKSRLNVNRRTPFARIPDRSYVLDPYTLVKDHRTLVETNDIESVMSGNIDDFLKAKRI